jgi:predicted outer membrane repeat protein
MVTLTNLILTAGNGTDSAGRAGNGGALLVDSDASVTLNGDIFNSNNTTGKGTNGGAIENDGSTVVNGCAFSGNNSVNNGGAIENTNYLSIYYMGSTVSSFNTNTAANGNGGAIDSSGNGSGTLNVGGGTTFDKNSAQYGGAINTNDSFSITDDRFGTSAANVATAAGGAICAQGPEANNDVTSCTFANNQASLGGAIFTTTTLDVERSTFSLNTASTNGGALDVGYQDKQNNPNSQTLTLNLDTFDQNSAQLDGGGAFILANPNHVPCS